MIGSGHGFERLCDALRDDVIRMVGRHKVEEWYERKYPELDNMSPKETIERFGETGITRVRDLINQKLYAAAY